MHAPHHHHHHPAPPPCTMIAALPLPPPLIALHACMRHRCVARTACTAPPSCVVGHHGNCSFAHSSFEHALRTTPSNGLRPYTWTCGFLAWVRSTRVTGKQHCTPTAGRQVWAPCKPRPPCTALHDCMDQASAPRPSQLANNNAAAVHGICAAMSRQRHESALAGHGLNPAGHGWHAWRKVFGSLHAMPRPSCACMLLHVCPCVIVIPCLLQGPWARACGEVQLCV